ALLYLAMRNFDKAEPLQKRSLEISEKVYGPDHPEVSTSLGNLALLYITQGEINKAEPLLERALATLEKKFGPDSEKLAIVLNNLSVVHQRRGGCEKGIWYGGGALAINEKAFGVTHPLIATSLSNLTLAYLANGDTTNAIRYSIRNNDCVETELVRNLVSGSQRQKLAYLNIYAEDTDLAISLHVNSAPDNSDALRGALTMILRRKGRAIDAMTDSISTLRRRASADDQKLLDQLASARSELSALTLRGSVREGAQAYKATLKTLEQQSENLESQISERSLEFRARLTPISFENVRKAVPHNAALLEFAVYRPINVKAAKKEDRFGKPRYVAYVLRDYGDPSWVELGDAQKIDDKINAFRSALRNKLSQNVKRLAREVDSLVMQPVRRLLEQTRRVLISPDGALNLIPFAALVDEHNQYLVRRFSFTYL